jgi:hypothetical protein
VNWPSTRWVKGPKLWPNTRALNKLCWSNYYELSLKRPFSGPPYLHIAFNFNFIFLHNRTVITYYYWLNNTQSCK